MTLLNSKPIDTSVCSSAGNNPLLPEDVIDMQTFQTCSVYCLKRMILKQVPGIPVSDQVLTYHGQTLENHQSLLNYKITHSALPLHKQSIPENTGVHSSSGGCTQDQ